MVRALRKFLRSDGRSLIHGCNSGHNVTSTIRRTSKYSEAQEKGHWGEWAGLETQMNYQLTGTREKCPPSRGGNTGKTLAGKAPPSMLFFFFSYNKYLLSTHCMPGTSQVAQCGWSSRSLRQELGPKAYHGHCHEKEGSRSGRHHGGAPNTFCDWFNVRDKGELTTEDNLKILSLVTKKLRDKANGGGTGLEKIIK